jgi:hypothetical protein
MSANHQDESPLFLMRLWGEDDSSVAGEGDAVPAGTDSAVRSRWRGKLLHVATGEARYFSGWPALLSILQSMFPEGADIESRSTPITSGQD